MTELVGPGVLATGTKAFSVAPETPLHVPIFNVNDLPPVLGVFLTTAAAAPAYFFGQSQDAGRRQGLASDRRRDVHADRGWVLAGPVPIAGTEAHVITLGALVHPLSSGPHTVEIRGGIFGDLVDDTYGVTST